MGVIQNDDERVCNDFLIELLRASDLVKEYEAWLPIVYQGLGIPMVDASLETRGAAVLNAIANSKPRKHVIFLGAGASASAGFPVGMRLAELMKRPSELRIETISALQQTGVEKDEANRLFETHVANFVKEFENACEIFRRSGYSTIDQFSKEARHGDYRIVAQAMKRLIRLILSIPGARKFDVSDYPRFIEKLFATEGKLRSDVTIVTFNYDLCLEYHLYEQLRCRNEIRRVISNNELFVQHSALSSGLSTWPSRGWSNSVNLKILKLHGATMYCSQTTQGSPPTVVFGDVVPSDVFDNDLKAAIPVLCNAALEDPPIAFPFEIFQENGEFMPETEFPVTRRRLLETNFEKESLREYFQFLWSLAREEVQQADKVSFVGLSFHPFLNPGMRFLFNGRSGPLQVVNANPDNKLFEASHVESLANRTFRYIEQIIPGTTCLRSSTEAQPIKTLRDRSGVTTYDSFAHFIAASEI